MEFNKNELHILKFLSLYKAIAVFSMVFGILAIPYNLYYPLFSSQSCAYSSNALIGASMVVLGMGYILHCFVRLIGVFKRQWVREGERGSP